MKPMKFTCRYEFEKSQRGIVAMEASPYAPRPAPRPAASHTATFGGAVRRAEGQARRARRSWLMRRWFCPIIFQL